MGGLGDRADLVGLQQDGIAGARCSGGANSLCRRDEVVVAHDLHVRTRSGGKRTHPVVIVLRERILNGHDWVAAAPVQQNRCQLFSAHIAMVGGKSIARAVTELSGRDVNGQRRIE